MSRNDIKLIKNTLLVGSCALFHKLSVGFVRSAVGIKGVWLFSLTSQSCVGETPNDREPDLHMSRWVTIMWTLYHLLQIQITHPLNYKIPKFPPLKS